MKHPFLHIHRLLMKTLWPFLVCTFAEDPYLVCKLLKKEDLIDNPIYVRLFSNL